MKKTSFLWLLAVAALIIVGILVIRPPAWATPIGAVQHAVRITSDLTAQPEVTSLESASEASLTQPDASQVEFQADTPSSDNCIACHTDKKKLKAVAEEPEEVKSEEASGEG